MSAQYHQVDQQLRNSAHERVPERHPDITEMDNLNGHGGHNERPTEQRSSEPQLRTQTSFDMERAETTEDDMVRLFQTYFGYSMLTSARLRLDRFVINTSFEGHELFSTLTNRESSALVMK